MENFHGCMKSARLFVCADMFICMSAPDVLPQKGGSGTNSAASGSEVVDKLIDSF